MPYDLKIIVASTLKAIICRAIIEENQCMFKHYLYIKKLINKFWNLKKKTFNVKK
jgi:hypothetical protein